ncbi:MAG: hypothetical protein KME40_07045 [Komarekiella atlantica HA4396-MV6]|jgi:putative N-acetylmannosamine-6-phosphate epimerase|nr:hypothetical protein [Komarekiella atlantica HA4396-MV6]
MNRISTANLGSIYSGSFYDSERLLQNLSDIDSILIHGGKSDVPSENIENMKFGIKVLEYALVGFAIHNITSLVKLFLTPSKSRF